MKCLQIFALLCLAVTLCCSIANAAALCACGRNLEPVCGSDQQTYSNECSLQCSVKEFERTGRSLTLAYEGPC